VARRFRVISDCVMGLDVVAIVMATEEEFGIQITDADAEMIVRVGELHAFVVRKLRERNEPGVDETDIWKRFQQVVVDQLGVSPESVTPSARFIEDLGVS
jgi:acyl carrier protein